MTPSKVLLYVLGTIALLNVASAKPSTAKKRWPLGGKPRTQVGGGPEVIQSMQQHVAKRIRDIARRFGKQQDGRCLEQQGLMLVVHGNGDCGSDQIDRVQLQSWIETEQCLTESEEDRDPEDPFLSTSWGFDSHSVIYRQYVRDDCTGPRNVTVLSCGCAWGYRIAGDLCTQAPSPAAHITINMDTPGMCASSETAFKFPVWEGCYHASMFFGEDRFVAVKSFSHPEVEVYARVKSTGAQMIYSLHNDTNCLTYPRDLLSTSCDCITPQDDFLPSLVYPSWHLTGDFCDNAGKPDARLFAFARTPSPCTAPLWQAALWFGECQPLPCSSAVVIGEWEERPLLPCPNGSMLTHGDPDSKTITVSTYDSLDCGGPVGVERRLGCMTCVNWEYEDDHEDERRLAGHEDSHTSAAHEEDHTSDAHEDDHEDDDESEMYMMAGPFCAQQGGQCKKVARSEIPDEIQDKLMPCVSM